MEGEGCLHTDQDLGTGRIGRLLLNLAVPCIVAQMVNALYNMVDRMYLGNMPEIGAKALTGVGVTFPVIMIITAFANLVGMGGAPLASISLGEGEPRRAERILGNCFVLLCLVSAALMLGLLPFGRSVLLLFGASAETIVYAQPYLFIYVLGTPFVLMTLGLNPFINAQGYARMSMITVLIGAIANIILDPVFIFVFGMGVQGAALATIIAQAISCAWVLRFLAGGRGKLRLRRSNFKLEGKLVGRVLGLGMSPFIMSSTESLVQITLNTSLRALGGDLYVGAMTILSSLMQLAFMPLTGLAQGAQPIIGYNFGARNFARVRKTFWLLFWSSLAFATAFWALCMLKPGWLVGIFNREADMMALGMRALRIYMGAGFIMALQQAPQQSFVAMGQAKISTFFALLRKVILLIPLALMLPRVGNLGVMGVFWAEPIADTLSATTVFVTFLIMMRKLLPRSAGEISTLQP